MNDKDFHEVAIRLAAELFRRGLTQQEIAAVGGIGQTTVSHWKLRRPELFEPKPVKRTQTQTPSQTARREADRAAARARAQEVIRMLGEGKKVHHAALALGISDSSIYDYRRRFPDLGWIEPAKRSSPVRGVDPTLAVPLLAQGMSRRAAGAVLGVHHTTINSWLKRHPELFAAA